MTSEGERAVDAYIEAAPEPVRPMLRELRRLIKAAAPDADEKISYGMPFYEHRGRLVYFAAYENHIGLYPVGRAKDLYGNELKRYLSGKASVRFPIGEPLPAALITKLVKTRVEENEGKPAPPEESA
jgi:uncharacterized protein YdhG (YjbR/CyaY superfamily)